MADVEIKPAFQSTEPDNPTEPNAVNASRWNANRAVSGGTHRQLMQRDTTPGGTGASYTDEPLVTSVSFSLAAPGATPAIGGFWVEDDGTTVTMKIRRANGDVLSMEIA